MRKLLRFVLVCLLAAGCFRLGGLLALREHGAESLRSLFWNAYSGEFLHRIRGAFPQDSGLLRQIASEGMEHFFHSDGPWLFPAIRAIMAAK